MGLRLGLLVGGAALAVVLALVMALRKRGPSTDDLGPISDQWIQHIKGQSDSSQ